MPKAQKVQWTGKNLAAIKKVHKDVKHYPEKPGDEPYFRDWTQHPDNLHITTDEGHTVIAEIGDSLVKDEDGRVTVQRAAKPRAPRALRPAPPPKRVINVTAGRPKLHE